MAHYVNAGTQTIIAGLANNPSALPTILTHHSDATTPPDDMPSKADLQLPANPFDMEPSRNVSPTLLRRRKNRPLLITRISLPTNDYKHEAPLSPPPTQALMSPLPAANTMHAGHTPIFPRSRSSLQRRDSPDSSGQSTPRHDEGLSGPLSLPALPGDGSSDRIELAVLDAELERVAHERERESRSQSETSSPVLNGDISGAKMLTTASTRRSSENEVEVVDGVILKKPKWNMGAPLGQA
jgi:hypothetical protein